MRRLRLPWWSAPIILFLGLVAGGLLAPDAHAEPAINATAVCKILAETPTVAGVTAIIAEVVKETGIAPEIAFRGVTVAIAMQCPERFPVIQKFIDRYSAAPELKQGYIA